LNSPDDFPRVATRKTGRPKGAKTQERREPADVKPAALRIASAARYIDVSESMMAKLIRTKRVTSVAVGRTRLVLTESLDALLRGDG
jgi:excisionase family DNA binding protein